MNAVPTNMISCRRQKSRKISILPLLVIPLLIACNKEDAKFPKPVVAFSTDPKVIEVGAPVKFENLSLNAAKYSWDFNDGQTSEAISPTITFDASDTYSVKLVAITADNQKDSVIQDIYVGQRYLTGVGINSLAYVNDKGHDWDDPGTGPDSTKLPDFILIMGPQSDPSVGIATPLLTDLAQSELPIGFQLNPDTNPFILTPETWDMSFLDFDGTDINNAQNSDFEVMNDITFNPVTIPTSVVNDKGEGFIQLSIGPYSVDLLIKIQ